MPLTAAQTLIIAQVGDEVTTTYPSGVLATNIAAIWTSYDGLSTDLQKLYTKRDCIDLVLGAVRGQVDFEIANDHSRKQSQKYAALIAMRQVCQQDIDRVANGAAFSVTPVRSDGYATLEAEDV